MCLWVIIYHDRSAGFVVQAANPEGKTSEQAAHDIVQSIQEGTAEWIYVLPFYQRATRVSFIFYNSKALNLKKLLWLTHIKTLIVFIF